MPLPSLFSVGLGVLLMGCTPSPQSSASPSPSSPSSAPVAQTSPAAPQPAPNRPAAAQPVTNQPTTNQPTGQMLPISAEATIRGQRIQLEVARTIREQAMGLMFRPVLPDDRGMLFPFDPPRPLQFWMKNTPQPLDMVFMLNGEVKEIVPSASPCMADPCPTYGTDESVNQVIELRGGRAAELGLRVGDRIEIRYLDRPRQ